MVRKCTYPTQQSENDALLAPARLFCAVQRITRKLQGSDGVVVLRPFLGVSSLDFQPLLVGGFFLSGASALPEYALPHKHDCATK